MLRLYHYNLMSSVACAPEGARSSVATRPEGFPQKVWAKLDDAGKVHAAKVWATLPATHATEISKDDVIQASSVADAIETLMAVGNDAETTGDARKGLEPPASFDDMPADVQAWMTEEASKVTPELSAYVHETVEAQIANDERKIILFTMIDEAGLDVPGMDTKPDPKANSMAARLGDVYQERKFSAKGEELDPQTRHRLHDMADKLFGNGYVKEVKRLSEMSKEAVAEYGDNLHAIDLALAKKKLSVLRRKFAEAADAVVAYRASNNLAGIDVVISNSKSPKPFLLRERMLDKNGNTLKDKDGLPKLGRSTSISLADLEAFRPTVAVDKLTAGEIKKADGSPGTMYDAIRASRPPKKKRGAKTQGTAAGGMPVGNDVSVNNINQWESASADEANLIEQHGFMADWLKRVNDPDKEAGNAFLLSEYAKYKFYDRTFGMNNSELMTRAGALLDAKATATKIKAAA